MVCNTRSSHLVKLVGFNGRPRRIQRHQLARFAGDRTRVQIAVPPLPRHHLTARIDCGGAPRTIVVGAGALGVYHGIVNEGEDTRVGGRGFYRWNGVTIVQSGNGRNG